MSDILTEIVAHKRVEIAARRTARPLAQVESAAASASAPRGFFAALARRLAAGEAAVIAECKKASPSKGLIRKDYDPAAIGGELCTGRSGLSLGLDRRTLFSGRRCRSRRSAQRMRTASYP